MFGKSNRRASSTPPGDMAQGMPAFDYRLFLTTDARQYAFDDDHVILTSQSGLAGLRPLWGIIGAEAPNGFDYMTNLIGLGGTPAPVGVQTPLIDNPQFTNSFFADQPGL